VTRRLILLAAVPAKHLGGAELAWVFSGTALLLCLVPGLITIAWAGIALRQDPAQQLTMILGATGVRMFGVLLIALLLYQNVPPYQGQDGFLLWLVVCYLFTLTLELTLLLTGRPRSDSPA